MERLFDVATPEEAAAATAAGVKAGNFYLSLFSGRGTGVGSVTDNAAKNWFKDGYSTVPGSMGGSVFSVIYTEGSKTLIYIESTKLINKNYQKYKDAPGSKAQNIIIDAEDNGTANVFFINDNTKTKWDLTGVSKETTEIVGDFNISENTQSLEQRMTGDSGGAQVQQGGQQGQGASAGGQIQGGMPGGSAPGGMGGPEGMDSGTKGNFINVRFQNSEWTGTVIGFSKNASLNFDEKSSWKVTAPTWIHLR